MINAIANTSNVMLLTEYKAKASKVQFPALVQQKIDGYRCVYIDGKFYSRQGTEFTHPSLAPIAAALSSVQTGIAIDGELQHADGTYSSTGRIFGADGDDHFVFHIFDQFAADGHEYRAYSERYDSLHSVIRVSDMVQIVANIIVNSHVQIQNQFFTARSMGHEGIVIKNIVGKYMFGRSTDAQKLKTL